MVFEVVMMGFPGEVWLKGAGARGAVVSLAEDGREGDF